MRAVITGVAGFIGSHVADQLLNAGWEVLGIDDLTGGCRENVPTGVEFYVRDCGRPLDDLFQPFRPTVVFHLAAYAAEGLSHHIPVFNYQNNIVATANVLAASKRCGVQRFIFTSSIAVYGHPTGENRLSEETLCRPCDPYGIAKLACEQHLRACYDYFEKPEYTIFRPHNVYGPRQNISDPYRNVVGIFIRSAMRRLPMPIFGDGSQTRSFSHIGSVAQCIAESATKDAAKNATFNVGGDEPLTVLELAKRISSLFDLEPNIEFLPARKEVQHAHASHERARAAFPEAYDQALNLNVGLQETVGSFKGQTIPEATECPSAIELPERLPLSWKTRLDALDDK